MRRREFITFVGGVATAWPAVARAQQKTPPSVSFLCSGSPASDAFRVAAIRQDLKESGYVDGNNAAFEYRWAEDHYERLPSLAAELVRREVSVIVLFGNASAVAAKSATVNIPIVFAIGGDPIKMGLVTSFRRPEGNVTGVSFLTNTVVAKQLEVLHELVPMAPSVGFLMNPTNPNADRDTEDMLTTAETFGMKLLVLNARTSSELEKAFITLIQQRTGALVVAADNFLTNQRNQIVGLATREAVPVIYPLREFVEAGGLMSYGTRVTDAYRTVGLYAGRILKGEKPADLPVQQSTKVELVINLNTAKALGFTMPQTLLARADEVIE
jgi:putative ABC transport system substrate-binding protein